MVYKKDEIDPEEGLAYVGELARIGRLLRKEIEGLGRPSSPVRFKRPCRSAETSDTVRGLAAIAKVIAPGKPVCTKTVLKLIRRDGLPAVKRRGMGWIASRKAVCQWMNSQTTGEKS